VLIFHIQSQFASVSAHYIIRLDRCKTRDMSHFLRRKRRSLTPGRMREDERYLDGRESLKVLRGTPLGIIRTSVNARYRISPRVNGGEGGCVAPRKIPQSCSSRLREIRHPIHPSCYSWCSILDSEFTQ